MRFIMLALATTAALFAGTIAAAPATAQAGDSFVGPHVEGIIGGDRLQGGGHDSGLLYGGAAGWDLALGRTLRLGIEGEATDSTQKQCARDIVVAGDRLCQSAGRDLYVGGRLGAVIGPRTMVYAKAGYSNARQDVRYSAGTAAGHAHDHADLDGVRVGAGVEQALGRHLFVKGEYRYSNYEHGIDRHQLLAGLGYRF